MDSAVPPPSSTGTWLSSSSSSHFWRRFFVFFSLFFFFFSSCLLFDGCACVCLISDLTPFSLSLLTLSKKKEVFKFLSFWKSQELIIIIFFFFLGGSDVEWEVDRFGSLKKSTGPFDGPTNHVPHHRRRRWLRFSVSVLADYLDNVKWSISSPVFFIKRRSALCRQFFLGRKEEEEETKNEGDDLFSKSDKIHDAITKHQHWRRQISELTQNQIKIKKKEEK